jgi:hypothetical protein
MRIMKKSEPHHNFSMASNIYRLLMGLPAGVLDKIHKYPVSLVVRLQLSYPIHHRMGQPVFPAINGNYHPPPRSSPALERYLALTKYEKPTSANNAMARLSVMPATYMKVYEALCQPEFPVTTDYESVYLHVFSRIGATPDAIDRGLRKNANTLA